MQKNSENFSIEEAKRLAKSPAAQQLMAMLKQSNSQQLQKAMELANSGDLKSASQIINDLLSSNDQAQGLMDQLRR